MFWTQVLLGNSANLKPFFIPDVEVPEGEQPKDFVRLDFGDQQEHTAMFQKTGCDVEEKRVYYIRFADYRDGRLAWQLGDPSLEISTRFRNSLKRLAQFTTEEDEGDLLAQVALVLERVADDFEAKKMWDDHGRA